ncbi:MAG: TldD/PmbA family protein [Candidatus Bathyarchaeota archaeon]|nr:TldD/PmbA family protein [Candidatus Bathyarchaeota archaeon]
MERFEEDWQFLGDTARKVVRQLERKGVSAAEAFFSASRTTEVTIRNSQVLTENAIEDMGVGFRVATSDNRVGFACTNIAGDEKVLAETGEKAFSIAKLSPSSLHFALPENEKSPHVDGLFDKEAADIAVTEFVDVAYRLIRSVENVDRRVKAKDGRVSCSHSKKGVVNSFGVDKEADETYVFAYVLGTGMQNGEVTPSCYDFELKRKFKLNPEDIGAKVGRMVVAQFNPKPIESFEGVMVFEPEAVSYQICDALIHALKGENVAAGNSCWVGKIGSAVASEKLTIVDDGVSENGFGSRSFDDEGYPSQKTVLVSNGKLESFLHHAATANKLKMKNTGNASRFNASFEVAKQIIGNGYKAKPEVYPSNLIIQAGKKDQSQLISKIKKGLLIGSMAGFVQAGSGLISAQLARAHYVENGQLKHPVKGGMVTGIAFDWLNRVSDLANDSKQFQNSVVPSICVENVKVIGSR